MTTVATTTPSRATRTPRRTPEPRLDGARAGVAATGRRPRLLLPPVHEPPSALPEGTALLPPALRSVRSPATDSGWPGARPQRPTERTLPDPASVCGPVVLATVEALAGTRPLTQLVRWVTPAVYEALAARVPTGA